MDTSCEQVNQRASFLPHLSFEHFRREILKAPEEVVYFQTLRFFLAAHVTLPAQTAIKITRPLLTQHKIKHIISQLHMIHDLQRKISLSKTVRKLKHDRKHYKSAMMVFPSEGKHLVGVTPPSAHTHTNSHTGKSRLDSSTGRDGATLSSNNNRVIAGYYLTPT